jgi:acyl dehydratase
MACSPRPSGNALTQSAGCSRARFRERVRIEGCTGILPMTNPLPRACMTINDLNVGDTLRREYSISDSDVQKFGEISGDFNPAHFDEDYAKGTKFKNRIAHGMISVAKFSGIFGMDMPGLGAIWGSQNLKFLAPVQLNEPYTAIALVKEIGEKNVVFTCWVEDKEGKHVLEGEGVLYPIPQKVKAAMAADGSLASLLA